jgi:hypothetical protein
MREALPVGPSSRRDDARALRVAQVRGMDEGFGWRFWAAIFGVIVVACLAAFVLFVLLGYVWVAWGALGVLVVGVLIGIGVKLILDRHRRI